MRRLLCTLVGLVLCQGLAFGQALLNEDELRNLPPDDAASKGLTVTIWLARQGGEITAEQISDTSVVKGEQENGD